MSDDRSSEIRQQMGEIRSALRQDATAIVENAKLSVNWRHYVEQHPWICLAAAAGLGYLLVPRAVPRMKIDGSTVDQITKELKSAVQPTKEQSKGFLAGLASMALPLLAKVALQGGTAFLQSRFAAHGNASSGNESKEGEVQRPSRPR